MKDAKGTTLGKPYVKDASVSLKVMAHRRGPKVIVYKMRPKKKTRSKNGHRQELTRVMVESISVGGKSISWTPNDTSAQHHPLTPWHIRKARAQPVTVATRTPSVWA